MLALQQGLTRKILLGNYWLYFFSAPKKEHKHIILPSLQVFQVKTWLSSQQNGSFAIDFIAVGCQPLFLCYEMCRSNIFFMI